MSITRTKCLSISGAGTKINSGKSEFELDARQHAHVVPNLRNKRRSRFALLHYYFHISLTSFVAEATELSIRLPAMSLVYQLSRLKVTRSKKR